jgi:hypothetical protein
MSFHVQPAPRIKNAPSAVDITSQPSQAVNPPVCAAASATAHQQGNCKSHVPIGLSALLNRK